MTSISRNKNFTASVKLFMRTNALYACREDRARECHKMTQNQIAYWTLQESRRSNQVREAETMRSNKAKEAENYRTNTANEQIKAAQQRAQQERYAFQNAADFVGMLNPIKGVLDVVGGVLA